jgi:hypothetical protein
MPHGHGVHPLLAGAREATQAPVMTERADLVAILEELHDVLVRIDDESVDRRYVDFAALAKRLEECIEAVERLPKA